MSHFMVRPIAPVTHSFFRNAPQIGKRFFYSLNPGASGVSTVVDGNTVINYDCTLFIGKADLERLICDMTGSVLPGVTSRYGYHLDKQMRLCNRVFLASLNVPNSIGNYELTSVAVAANHSRYLVSGNILIIFNDSTAPFNELVISLHITKDRNPSSRYGLKKAAVAQLVHNAVQALQPGHSIYDLKPSNFRASGYEVTSGKQQAIDYDAALTAQLFAELPNI